MTDDATQRPAGEPTRASGTPDAPDAGDGSNQSRVDTLHETPTDTGGGIAAESPPAGGTADATDEQEEAKKGPTMVRRVVCSYKLGWLPGDWLQTWRRLDRVFYRANLKVKATLAPLEDLPADTDILVVPPDLRDAAREAVPPGTPILVTPASAAAGAFADLVTRLQAGTDFTAEKVDPADRDKPKIVSYRGHTILD